MILYFSATGNSEYVARRIAAETGDIAVSITDCYKKQIFSFDEKCKTLGIVSPTYSWGLPVIVISTELRRLLPFGSLQWPRPGKHIPGSP